MSIDGAQNLPYFSTKLTMAFNHWGLTWGAAEQAEDKIEPDPGLPIFKRFRAAFSNVASSAWSISLTASKLYSCTICTTRCSYGTTNFRYISRLINSAPAKALLNLHEYVGEVPLFDCRIAAAAVSRYTLFAGNGRCLQQNGGFGTGIIRFV